MTEEAARDAEDQKVLDATQRGHFGARRRQPQLCALPSMREYALCACALAQARVQPAGRIQGDRWQPSRTASRRWGGT